VAQFIPLIVKFAMARILIFSFTYLTLITDGALAIFIIILIPISRLIFHLWLIITFPVALARDPTIDVAIVEVAVRPR
jgi:hypothetical protein